MTISGSASAPEVAYTASRLGDHARAQRTLTEALAWWRGRALADVPDCPFAQATRASLEGERQRAELALLAAMVDQGQAGDALPDLERAVAERPLDEALAAVLVRGLAAVGRQADALAAYEATRARLVEDLGLDPGPVLREAQAAVLEQRGPQPERARILPLPPLPRPRTSLLGRDRDLDALAVLLDDTAPPIVTLTGPGGVGKTRVALAVAARFAATRPVVFVELAALTDADQVLPAVATAIDVEASDHRALPEMIARMLRGTGALLVLDNFEHLLDATADLDRLVGSLDDATGVLVTSRSPLRIVGERVLLLEPLATTMPSKQPHGLDRQEGTAESPAVTLFRERAEAAHPGALDHSQATTLSAVCNRLDGLPLAIELAAARADLAPPELLLTRLDKRLTLLGSGPRTVPPRHRNLHACIRWSVDQLLEAERHLFAALSVFIGGATLTSAEQLAVRLFPDLDVLTALDTLASHSLVRVHATAAGPRVSMLETIREFAREESDAYRLTATAHTAHADHYLAAFTPERSIVWWPPRTLAQYQEWTAEMPNARLALVTLRDVGREADAAALAVALWPMWINRGEVAEAEAQLSQVMANPGIPYSLQAQVVQRLSLHADQRGDLARSDALLTQALSICRRDSDPWLEAQILKGMADLADMHGEAEVAVDWERQARARAEQAQDPELLMAIKALPRGGRDLKAVQQTVEGLGFARAHGNEVLTWILEGSLSDFAASINDPDLWQQGKQWGESAAAAADAWGSRAASLAWASSAATCGLLLGDDARVVASQLRTTLDWCVRTADPLGAVETQLRLAAALSAAGDGRAAAGLAAAARRLGAQMGVQLDDTHLPVISRFLDVLPEQLGSDEYEDAVKLWATLTWEQAADKALAPTDPAHL